MTKAAPASWIPQRNFRVQELRPAIHGSFAATSVRTSSSRERSWAWPSGVRKTSVARPVGWSRTASTWPGSGASQAARNSTGRRSVAERWLPSAVEDADPVAGQPGRPAGVQGVDDRGQTGGGVADQGRRDARLHAVELVVDRLIGDGDLADALAVSGADRRLLPQDDRGHQLDELRAEELPGVLLPGGVTEQFVEAFAGEEALQGGTSHHTERGVLDEGLEGGGQHPGSMGQIVVNSCISS